MPGSDFERKQAERRLAAYREMADMEIESILATMMTICTYDNAANEDIAFSEARRPSDVVSVHSNVMMTEEDNARRSSEDLFY